MEPRPSRWMRSAGIVAALVLGTVGAFEAVFHALLQPSRTGYGILFGQDLPPYRVVMESGIDTDSSERVWQQKGKSNPLELTQGDLWGILAEDVAAGYASAPGRTSKHGWWQSNDVGARSRVPTAPRIPEGLERIAVFGASYAQGSRVHQDSTWFNILQTQEPGAEIVNLAVDGYSMGQSLMRLDEFRRTHDLDTAVFVFVPDNNVWRDVNTSRHLGEGWWTYTVLPRYVLENGVAKKVPGPYPVITDIYKHDLPVLTDRVRDHLRRYDPFYVPLLHESPPVVGRSILFKMVARILGEKQRTAYYEDCRSWVDSDGMQVIRGIFRAAEASLRKDGKTLVVVLIPDTEILDEIRKDPRSPRTRIWEERLQALSADHLPLVDLLPDFRKLPDAELDRGYDGSHYGPRTNAALARFMRRELTARGLLGPPH